MNKVSIGEYNTLVNEYNEVYKENKRLKMIIKEYERLNKENSRGFKITNVQEYNIDELLSYKKYKDNWNKLKEWVKVRDNAGFEKIYLEDIICEIQELENGDSNEI